MYSKIPKLLSFSESDRIVSDDNVFINRRYEEMDMFK